MIRYGSVCSGIEAASVAWHSLGWSASFLSEIEAFPRAVLAHHYPTIPLHGDFTTIGADDYGSIDLLVGGTPCQSFSVAGLRGGLADKRGNLALEYLRLVDRKQPRWLLWENVPGVLSSGDGRDFGSFLGGVAELGYGFAYRVLDAQYFGLAQRRKRVFVVGYLGDWRRAAAVLFEPASLRGNPAPCRETRERVAPTLTRGSSNGGRTPGLSADDCESLISTEIAHPLLAKGNSSHRADAETYVAHCLNAHGGSGRIDAESETFVTVACMTSQLGSHEEMAPTLRSEPGGLGYPINSSSAVRRLTPRECERLQGFPDDYTSIPYRHGIAADGPRYKALGNSMAVPVMSWIGRRIASQHASAGSAA